MMSNEGTWDRIIRILVGLAVSTAALITWPANATVLSAAGFINLFLSLPASRCSSPG
jgi:hypothetical protein